MIDALSSYSSKVLSVSVFMGIIHMLLPSGTLKQNVTFACLMVITMILMEPMITFLNSDIDMAKMYEENKEAYELEIAKVDFEKNYQNMLYQTFEENMEEDIIHRLQNVGYIVKSVSCEIDQDTFEPKFLRVEIETQDGFVQPVRIEVMGGNQQTTSLSKMQEYEIKRILMENYGVAEDSIILSGR